MISLPRMPQFVLYIVLIALIIAYYALDNPKGFEGMKSGINDIWKRIERWVERQ